ncbi:MAG: hypothetical protein Q8M99_03355 [Methylotenera sp.]|nr:hypothetical protein [Methylotenera sp.]
MSLKIRLLFYSLVLVLSVFNVEAAVTDISRIYNEIPSLNGFEICSGGGCAEIWHVKISNEEWQQVAGIFASTEANVISQQEKAAQERDRIAQAVGVLETIVGDKTGTATDRAGTFDNSNFSGQLDCNDEAINTTNYIRLMRQTGLIQWHEVEDMRTRNFFFSGWPHTTAVIHEIANGQRYAVDSWFYDNGLPATIVPFSVWKSGYIPEDSPLADN